MGRGDDSTFWRPVSHGSRGPSGAATTVAIRDLAAPGGPLVGATFTGSDARSADCCRRLQRPEGGRFGAPRGRPIVGPAPTVAPGRYNAALGLAFADRRRLCRLLSGVSPAAKWFHSAGMEP